MASTTKKPRMARVILSEPLPLTADIQAMYIHPESHREVELRTLTAGTPIRVEIRPDVPPDLDYVIVQTHNRKRWDIDRDVLEAALQPEHREVLKTVPDRPPTRAQELATAG